MVELVSGYDILISKRQPDEVLDSSANSRTRLLRNLLQVFFSKEVLAAIGERRHKALVQDILTTCLSKPLYIMYAIFIINYYYCIGFVQSKYTVTKTLLIDVVNGKCKTTLIEAQPELYL